MCTVYYDMSIHNTRKVDDWGYAARDLEKARWRIAKELESDRMWVTGEETMTKRQRIMGCDS